MSNAIYIKFTDSISTSPIVYLHWGASEYKKYLEETKELMKDRGYPDVEYTCARFIGVCHSHIDGNVSLGVYNSDSELNGGVVTIDIREWYK